MSNDKLQAKGKKALEKDPRTHDWKWTRVRKSFIAHACAVLIKRVVRRERPHHPAVAVNVGTPSRLSFPSAHATSTTAASMLLARTTGLPLPIFLVPPMALSRLVLGVHYPSDVLTGVAVGAVVAKAVGTIADRVEGD